MPAHTYYFPKVFTQLISPMPTVDYLFELLAPLAKPRKKKLKKKDQAPDYSQLRLRTQNSLMPAAHSVNELTF